MTREEFFATVGPAFFQFLAIAVPALLTWIGVSMQRLRNKQAEYADRDALHKAIRTGVAGGLKKLGPHADVKQVIEYAEAYANKSVPDAMANLKPTADLFGRIAQAYITLETTHAQADHS